MDSVQSLVSVLDVFRSHARSESETWDAISYSGNGFPELHVSVRSFFEATISLGWACDIEINGDTLSSEDEYSGFAQRDPSSLNWKIYLNKDARINSGNGGYRKVLFINQDKFVNWTRELDPLNPNCVIKKYSSVHIMVNEISVAFGGPRLAVTPIGQNINQEWPQSSGFSEEKIRENVIISGSGDVKLDPSLFVLDWGELSSYQSRYLKVASIKSLSACLVQEVGVSEVTISGVQRISGKLELKSDREVSEKELKDMLEAVRWAYEERPKTRLRLFADRLSLEISDGKPLVSEISERIAVTLKQCRHQYDFVVSERKDEYARELRELLKDLRGEAESYSNKIRSVINGFLRDVLGGFVLVGIISLAKYGDNLTFIQSHSADVILKSYAVYLWISFFLQFCFHVRDSRVTANEMRYWAEAARMHMHISELNERFDAALSERHGMLLGFGLLIFLVYLVSGIVAWNLQLILLAVGFGE